MLSRRLTKLLKNISQKNSHNGTKNISKKVPKETDVVIIGGGAMGSSTAYWLKEKTPNENLRVTVIEKDPTYQRCSTSLSVGGLRQQFSMAENIELSMFGADFIKHLKTRFGAEADVSFHPYGYLFLSSIHGAEKLQENFKTQEKVGALHVLLDKKELKHRFPWLNVSDIELGCLGFESEGWFDPWSLLQLLKNQAKTLGTQFVAGEVIEFDEHLKSLVIKLPNGNHETIEFSDCVIAAGCDSGEIGRLAKIGKGSGLLSTPIPVEKRKRYVYNFICQNDAPDLGTPMVIDSSGAYFRREATGFITGKSPEDYQDEPSTDNLEVDYNFFEEIIWPIISHRVPAFNALKVVSAWSGFYEFNTFDQNGIIGRHPHYNNLYIATGFSGHGIQQSPAVGRAIAELILTGKYQSIDLTRLGFERIIKQNPAFEIRII